MPQLVLIETSGTQAYIFATNRLLQNVGASELCYRIGTEWTLDAVAEVAGRPSLWSPDTDERRRRLVDGDLNPRLCDGQAGVEVIVATSARAVALVGHSDVEQEGRMARAIVTAVTRRALEHAPGLGVTGIVQPLAGRAQLQSALDQARGHIGAVRAGLPGPEGRFLRLPPAASCATTGYPASVWAPPLTGEPGQAQSPVAVRKLAAARSARQRMRRETTISARSRLDRDVGRLEHHLSERWVAVIHADGNGMGKTFTALGPLVARRRADGADVEYADAYRELSLALEVATLRAFDTALREIARDGEDFVPLVPLVLGGDDLTVLCDGQRALPFVRRYLAGFEEECRRDEIIGRWTGGDLTASAGVALVKPHFPFHAAYDLAEDLLDGAKAWSRRCGAGRGVLDFLLLHDSVAAEVERLRRERWRSRDRRIALWAGPYLLNQDADGATSLQARHDISALDGRVEAIRARDDDTGRRRIPRTVLHDLRGAAVQGEAAAIARLALVQPTLAGVDGTGPLDPLLTDGRLWWDEDGGLVCPLVDAMDVARLLEDAG
jgi:hypothetical protein